MLDTEHETRGELRGRVLDALFRAQHAGLSELALFCHGWPDGLAFGFKGKDGAACLAAGIESATEDCTIVLYACSAGREFAPELARMLGPSFRVWAHSSRGHTTRNPQLVYCCGDTVVDVWRSLRWTRRRQLRELMRGSLRFELGHLTAGSLFEILDRERADTPG